MICNLNKKIIVFILITFFIELSYVNIADSSILLEYKNQYFDTSRIYDVTKKETSTPTEFDFDEEIMFFMKQGHMPSVSACIVKNDSVVWSKGYGLAEIYKGVEATENTIYLAASLSKTITTTAIMQLWEKGLFDLDEDVNLYLPFSLRNPYYPDIPITFRMLLAHHSSLSSGEISLFIYFSIFSLPIELLKQYIVPGGLFYNPVYWLDAPPGEQLKYSSIGYEILGYLVKILSGQPLDEYCKEYIFEPLEMRNTSYYRSDYKINELARPYLWILNSTYLPLPNYEDKNFAAGGVRTSVMDLSHFLIAYINGGIYKGVRILNEETIKLMMARQYGDNNNQRWFTYGLGWRISGRDNTTNIGHSGAMPGTLTYMYYQPEERTGIIFFTNQYPVFFETDIWSFINIVWLLYDMAEQL